MEDLCNRPQTSSTNFVPMSPYHSNSMVGRILVRPEYIPLLTYGKVNCSNQMQIHQHEHPHVWMNQTEATDFQQDQMNQRQINVLPLPTQPFNKLPRSFNKYENELNQAEEESHKIGAGKIPISNLCKGNGFQRPFEFFFRGNRSQTLKKSFQFLEQSVVNQNKSFSSAQEGVQYKRPAFFMDKDCFYTPTKLNVFQDPTVVPTANSFIEQSDNTSLLENGVECCEPNLKHTAFTIRYFVMPYAKRHPSTIDYHSKLFCKPKCLPIYKPFTIESNVVQEREQNNVGPH